MIRYDRLWKTMEDKELTQYRLIKRLQRRPDRPPEEEHARVHPHH